MFHGMPPNQLWPGMAWILQDLWRCPVVSGTNRFPEDPLTSVSSKVELPWNEPVVWTQIAKLDLIDLHKVSRPRQYLEHVLLFYTKFPNSLCFVEEWSSYWKKALPLENITAIMGYTWLAVMFRKVDIKVWSIRMTKSRFPSTALVKASHFFHWVVFGPQCIQILSLSQVNDARVPRCPHDAVESEIHWLGNLLPLLHGSVSMLIGCAVYGKLGLAWTLRAACSYTNPYLASFNAQDIVTCYSSHQH